MDTFLYITLGFIDVIAILALIFKLFRFPFSEYLKEFFIIGACLTIVSYLLRVQLNIPEVDMPIQFVLFVLFLRYMVKIRLFYSILLTTLGGISLILIQLIMIAVLLSFNVINVEDAQGINKTGTYIIQMFSQIVCFILSLFLFRFNLGFSFIMSPPHDVKRSLLMQGINNYLIYSVVVGVLVIFISLYFLLHNFSYLVLIGLVMILAIFTLFYLAHKKDYSGL